MKQRTHNLIATLFGISAVCAILASEPITAQSVIKAIGIGAAVVIAKLMPARGDDCDDAVRGDITATILKAQPDTLQAAADRARTQ